MSFVIHIYIYIYIYIYICIHVCTCIIIMRFYIYSIYNELLSNFIKKLL